MTQHPDRAAAPADPGAFWEARYGQSERIWSGRANAVLVDVASGLAPGTALDLGCGEGADVLWLADHGWRATGIDVSLTAVTRARAAAAAAGLDVDRARFVATDLAGWNDDQTFDLVTASFFHSPVHLPRADILRHASGLVAPGGHLLITSHAAPPPWSRTLHEHAAELLSADEELAALELDPDRWQVLLAETRARTVTGPDGEPASLDDAVVLVRRA